MTKYVIYSPIQDLYLKEYDSCGYAYMGSVNKATMFDYRYEAEYVADKFLLQCQILSTDELIMMRVMKS